MTKLRVLKIDDLHISGDFELLSKELRWLSWKGCPLKCIPSNFPSEKLVFLNMKGSNIQEFGLNLQYCRNLKRLDLSDCKRLRRTPNFKGSRSLETLWLENCSSLKEIHPSIGNLDRLTALALRGCEKITDLTSSICQLKSLQYLDINDCSSLQTLPVDIGDMQRLRVLDAGETGIRELPGSVEMLGNLINLQIGDLYLEAKRRFSQTRVRPVVSLSSKFISILRLPYCGFSEGDVPRNIESLSNLVLLDLSGNNFLYLPFDFSKLPLLASLYLNDCENLQTLPSISNLEKLRILEFWNCQKLVNITGLDKLHSIEKMEMRNCTSLQNPINEGFFSARALSISSREHQWFEPLQINLESNEIPDWCSNKVTAPSICLTMPTVHNNKFLGMILWFVCRLCDVHELIDIAVTVAHTTLSGFLQIRSFDRSDSHEVSCVYYFTFKSLNIKGGEQITVENETSRGTVKKIGIHLLYLDQHGNVISLPGVVDHSYTPSYPLRLSAGHINSNNNNISNEIPQVRSVSVDINEQSSESVFGTMENVFHRNRSWTWIYQMITMSLKCLFGKCFSRE